MKRVFFFAMALLLIFSSCEKDSTENGLVYEDFQSDTLIRQIIASETDMEVFTYYNTGKIFEHVQPFSYRKFLYNEQNQLTKIEIALSLNPLSCAIIPGDTFDEGDDPRTASINQCITFDYLVDGNIYIKVNYSVNADMFYEMYSSEYEFTNDKVTKINLFNPQGQLTQFYTYLYDDNGNVLQEENYFVQDGTDTILQTRKLSEYDNKKNPFSIFAVEGTPGISTNKNNITKETTIYYYDEEEQTYTVNYIYDYNDLGYPVKANNLEYIYGEEQ